MSYFYKSVPKDIALMMKDKHGLNAFVETGTYMGATAEWAAWHFEEVHTIEQNPEYFKQAEIKLCSIPNVTMWQNDSRNVLENVMNYLGNKRILFYLDAHWSEGAAYGRPTIESVAVDEVLIINNYMNKNHVIIIDDAHRFGTTGWPRKIDIVNALDNNGRRDVRELMDVFIATPRRHYEGSNASATDVLQLRGIRN